MGDMADFTLESIEWSIYNGYEDDDGYEQPTNTKTCKCCGRSGLHWAQEKISGDCMMIVDFICVASIL